MNAIIIILSYGARYEIPIFTAEQAEAYLKEYNEDNGFCYLYAVSYAEKAIKDLALKVFDNTMEFREFIKTNREEWVDYITDPKFPTSNNHINDFCLKSVFSY